MTFRRAHLRAHCTVGSRALLCLRMFSSFARSSFGALIAMLVLAATASAQEVVVAPRLRGSDEFRIEIVRTRENSAKPQQNVKGTTPVTVRVVAVTDESITIDWIPGSARYDNPGMLNDPMMKAAAAAIGDLNLRLTLSPAGEFVGVANEQEVVPRLQAALDVITRELSAKLPETQRPGFHAMMAQVLTPAALISSATMDAQMYFALHGATLDVGEDVEAEIEQPNPFGGAPFPAVFRVRAQSASDASALIESTTTYDATALLEMTRALVEKQTGKPLPASDAAKFPALEMSDTGKYTFDRTLGLMREVIVNRRVNAGPMNRLDKWEIRLVSGPQR
jgi:hypothetical protein